MARGLNLRRTTTWTTIGVLAILLAVPTIAFATPVSVPTAVAPPIASAPAASAPLGHQFANVADTGRMHATLAPLLQSPGRSVLPADRIPLYRTLAKDARGAAAAVSGASQLHGAISSLALGAGPAFGAHLSCSAATTTTATCAYGSARTAAAHSAVAAYDWQNATPGAGTVTYWGLTVYGSMAWDEYDQAIVYYGGCDLGVAGNSVCPDNQTWVFIDGYWQNFTLNGNTPPSLMFASMDYDYQAAGVLLFGGCTGPGGCATLQNQTWLFAAGFWYNVSAPYCIGLTCYFAPTPRIGATMAFANESADNVTILFGGCVDSSCTAYDGATWAWVGAGGVDAWVLTTPSTAPSPRGFANMAYDAYWGALILYGGCPYYCDQNDTWSYYNGAWTNVTAYNTGGGFATPPAGGEAQMTYDASLGELLLFGGIGVSTGSDTWAWYCGEIACGWILITPPLNLPGDIYSGGIASESSYYPPLVLGGNCYCAAGDYTLYETYVYESLFTAGPTVTPNPAPVLSLVTLTSNLNGGMAPYYIDWYTGDGSAYYTDTTYAYSVPGTYLVELYAYDFVGVQVYWNQSEVITTVAAHASASSAKTEVGVVDTFSTPTATGGTEPYTYNWSFGDGSYGSDLVSVTHAYTAQGVYVVNLNVTDANAVLNSSSVTVTVVAGPAVTASASKTSVDVGSALTFSSTSSGGVSPYTYNWSFADGKHASGASTSYTYTAAGTYKVVLNLTDLLGFTATSSVTVTVNPAVSGTASGTPTTVTAGGSVSFTAAGSGGSGTYTYTWNFGGGAQASTASASHLYAAAGTFTATVWINDTLGGSYHQSVTITVQPAASSGSNGSSTSGLGGWTLWAIVGIIIVVAAALVAVMMMRRRKPSEPASAPPTGASSGGMPPPPPGAQ